MHGMENFTIITGSLVNVLLSKHSSTFLEICVYVCVCVRIHERTELYNYRLSDEHAKNRSKEEKAARNGLGPNEIRK